MYNVTWLPSILHIHDCELISTAEMSWKVLNYRER